MYTHRTFIAFRDRSRILVAYIPILVAFLAKKWAKVHEKEFNKMDSIDDYIKKRQQRHEQLTKSNNTVQYDKNVILMTGTNTSDFVVYVVRIKSVYLGECSSSEDT